MKMLSVDVAIVGAGIAGQTLALGLAQADFSVVVIDAAKLGSEPATDFSPRVSAISKASEQIFRKLGAWEHIQRMQAYSAMHVWEDQSFGEIHFSATENQLDNLGHIIENNVLTQALFEAGRHLPNLTVLEEQRIQSFNEGDGQQLIQLESGQMVICKLLVGADGGNSFVRRQAKFAVTSWDYDHTAIVANIKTQEAHQLVARQAFTPSGPLAFLPLSEPNTCSIVWSQDTDVAESLLAMNEEAFCQSLQVALDNQLGKCELITPRFHYPLKMQYAQQWVSDGIVLVGDAAHTIHPLAGQGANLGLLDVASLVQTLSDLKAANKPFHTQKALRAYERWRKAEATKVIATMEGFKRMFSGSFAPLKLARGLGLAGANSIPPIKHFFIQQATGSAGKLPTLAK
jgi:2-octaprenylphenol hydroxylase